MSDHSTCASQLGNMAEVEGLDVTVSTAPPVFAGPYPTEAFTCPHGTRYYLQPTSEQITAWTRDGVR